MKKIIILLSILFTGTTYAQNFYGDFESWRSYTVFGTSLQAPSHWFSTDSLVFYGKGLFTTANFQRQVYKTTDAHSGSFAAKLMTLDEDTFGVIPALLTNADIMIDFATFDPSDPAGSIIFSGGTNVSSRIPTMKAWVKYFPKGNDTAAIYALAMKYSIGVGGSDSLIGSGQVFIGNTISNYTKVSIPITYFDTSKPDFIQILISSGGGGNAIPQDSSTLYVDDLGVETAGVNELAQLEEYRIYPNPATNVLHIEGNVANMEITNTLGQQVASFTDPHTVDISSLTPGLYSLQLRDKNGIIKTTVRLIKQ